MPEHEPTTNGRVSNRALQDGLDLVRAEQKTEHMKTRLIMVILASPGVARALPYVLGYLGLPTW